MGICVGDIFFFLAWRLLSECGMKDHSNLAKNFSRELIDVCLAQATDVRYGSYLTFPTLEDIVEVYTYKTANYTVTLPLCTGAILAEKPEAIPFLEEFGKNLGILFQLQDDYLGLFGDEKILGKPVGSDIREGKKTPFIILLIPCLSPQERQEFDRIFSSKSIKVSEIQYIRNLVIYYKIDLHIRALVEKYAFQANNALKTLVSNIPEIHATAFSLLEGFIEYSLSRSS
jgi:geranylgeranyl diphosphate synthase type I